jgi:DNA polymerase-4
MRKPDQPERLYLDFDGFFASCEQLAHPHLRGRPVGVVPFAGVGSTCIIACSREAKRMGVSNIMPVREALMKCPDLILQPQNPDLYRRAHNALLSEISMVVPIDAVKSIDELTCKLDRVQQKDPALVTQGIKKRLFELTGPSITCSIGYAANRQLAKMACKAGKPDGHCVWHPADMPGPLFGVMLGDIPGIGHSLLRRLYRAGIARTEDLYGTAPKQLRQLWGNVTGERLWYALHGYDLQAQPSARGMYGHGRVLPPSHRDLKSARDTGKLLLTKAGRRMRRDGFSASRLFLWLGTRNGLLDGSFGRSLDMAAVCDEMGLMAAYDQLWREALNELESSIRIVRLGVTLGELCLTRERQLDLLIDDEPDRRRYEAITEAMDGINRRYGKTVLSMGLWRPPPGGYAGGKISYTRIPRLEDFY